LKIFSSAKEQNKLDIEFVFRKKTMFLDKAKYRRHHAH